MHRLLFACLAAVRVVGAVPINAAEPVMNQLNLTMPNGTVVPVQLSPEIHFVPEPDTSRITKRLSWRPGNGNLCKTATDYPFIDKTTTGSPWVSDCKVVAATALDADNQGYFVALQGGDLHPNGNWCRLMYHGTCVFGIKTKSAFGAKVGSEDIGNTIIAALAQPEQRYDRMQWEGAFKCKSSLDDSATVQWAIFHS